MAKIHYMEMKNYMKYEKVQDIIQEIESIPVDCVISIAAMIDEFDLVIELLALNSNYKDEDDTIKKSIVTRRDKEILLQNGFYENDFGNFLKEYNYEQGDY